MPQVRRTRSCQDSVNDDTAFVGTDNEDEIEEETTRCICGRQEYPGLPNNGSGTRKDNSNSESDPVSAPEDSTGWFIQCDTCKVWQHGGCVGITDESTSPEDYYCEQCRDDFHKVSTLSDG